MKTLSHLQINQPFVALFGSGNSVHDLTREDFKFIKDNAFVFTLNYAPIHFEGHLNMWSDRRVSEFLQQFYETHPRKSLLLAQHKRVSGSLHDKVDFWFNRNEEKLHGNYTIVWALQLIKKYFPEKTILLFGVDMYADSSLQSKWYDRYTDFDRRKRGHQYQITSKLNQCADQIKKHIPSEGVINCNPNSLLDHFVKKDWRSLFKVRIAHLCSTPLAGAPAHLSRIITKYTACESRSILRNDLNGAGSNQLRWEYDLKRPGKKELDKIMQWSQVIHHHRRRYAIAPPGKPELIQYHSPPKGYQPGKTDETFNGRKLVIAQYHPRFYSDAYLVPNLIDIWDQQYLPEKKPGNVTKIFYSWATEVKGGWADKGSHKTKNILNQIKSQYGAKVEIKVLHNRPFEECMREKRNAHICIDECVTGSYHLQSLEGCSVGALTFNNIDQHTMAFLSQVTGQTGHPFQKTSLDHLYEKLCYFIEHPDERHRLGQESRQWMEQHWDPRKLVNRYLKAYYDVLLFGHIRQPQDMPPAPKTTSTNDRQPPTPPRTTPPRQKETVVTPPIHRAQAPTLDKPAAPSRLPGRPIQELFQQYKDESIYIFGTGPSLFKVNPKDFEDKICFGINYAFEVIPNLNYTFVHVIETYEVVKKVLDHRKLILPETLVPQWHRIRSKMKYNRRVPPDSTQAYIYPLQNPREKQLSQKHVALTPDTRIFTWSTTTHSAIHLAAYMGAREINLIGVDYQLYPDGKVHFSSRNDPEYVKQDWNANRKHQQGDEWLAQALALQGIRLRNLSSSLNTPNKHGLNKNIEAVLPE